MNKIRLFAWSSSAVYALLVSLFTQLAHAEPITIAVEDKDWAPYYVWVDGEPSGPCPETAAGAIRHMGEEVEFVRVPWVRVLLLVEKKRVDAGLCGTHNSERAAYSYYPDEPLLTYDATLFVRADSPLQTSEIAGLTGKSFGSVKGYSFGDVDKALEAGGMKRREVNNRDALLQQLISGKLDTVLDSVLPMAADGRKLGIQDQIRPLLPSLSETPGYLFFSQKPGHEELASRFSAALREFKETKDYSDIRARYGF
ncbi:MAG: transporter substrate-binding domain-containing protein [Pseudomonadota bacterium]